MNRFDSIYRPDLFEGRTVLITGGGTGIGRCTAHEFASLGANVLIGGRREDVLAETAEEIRSGGGLCDFECMDLRDGESVERAVAKLCERADSIDSLFNNAGGQFSAKAENISQSAWQKVFDLNLNGTFRVTRAVFDASMKEHDGSVVNMLADIHSGYVGMAHSAAARAGIENMTITLALEWARFDVRLNCVAPGTILSKGMLTYPEEVQESADIYLLSPAAAFTTGQTIAIDGGSSFSEESPLRHHETRPDLRVERLSSRRGLGRHPLRGAGATGLASHFTHQGENPWVYCRT
jgi:citronellol/citronellal dehydrogenase